MIVKGLVLSAHDHMPMERVSVMVEGSNYGTMSDAGGRFQLVATAGALLRLSHLSYQTQVLDIPTDANGEHAMVVLMKEDSAHQLDPVTVSRRDGRYFSRDFMNMKMADSLGAIARANLSKEKTQMLLYTTPTNGSGAYSLVRRQQEERAAATNRVAYVKFLDLAAWLNFFMEKRKKKRSRIKSIHP